MIYLASYKGTRPGIHGVVNRGIRLLDHSKYSHTEICIGNPFESEVDCYSSSGEDGGVRKKTMKLDPSNWDIVLIPWITEQRVLYVFEQTKGCGYDFYGTGRFALPMLLREHPTLWFCSEWAAHVIGLEEAWRYSPGGLHQISVYLSNK